MKRVIACALSADFMLANFYDQIFFLYDPWDAHALSLLSRLSVAFFIVMYAIPWKDLMLKSVAFIYMLTYVWDFVQFAFVGEAHLEFAVAFNVLIFAPWLLYAWYRSYHVESDAVSHERIYWVSHKPDSFTGFLVSLFADNPLGGSGILMDGTVYIYHRGKFKQFGMERMPADTIYIDSGMVTNIECIKYLKSMVGKEWHLWSNCLTMKRTLRKIHG